MPGTVLGISDTKGKKGHNGQESLSLLRMIDIKGIRNSASPHRSDAYSKEVSVLGQHTQGVASPVCMLVGRQGKPRGGSM